MEVFFSILFCIVLGIYVLRFVSRFILRYWLAKKMSQFQRGDFAGGGQSQSRGKRRGKEGEVKISHTQTEQGRIRDDVGEYVEFDEVK